MFFISQKKLYNLLIIFYFILFIFYFNISYRFIYLIIHYILNTSISVILKYYAPAKYSLAAIPVFSGCW